jgi:hypothetical protein
MRIEGSSRQTLVAATSASKRLKMSPLTVLHGYEPDRSPRLAVVSFADPLITVVGVADSWDRKTEALSGVTWQEMALLRNGRNVENSGTYCKQDVANLFKRRRLLRQTAGAEKSGLGGASKAVEWEEQQGQLARAVSAERAKRREAEAAGQQAAEGALAAMVLQLAEAERRMVASAEQAAVARFNHNLHSSPPPIRREFALRVTKQPTDPEGQPAKQPDDVGAAWAAAEECQITLSTASVTEMWGKLLAVTHSQPGAWEVEVWDADFDEFVLLTDLAALVGNTGSNGTRVRLSPRLIPDHPFFRGL